MRLTKKLVSLLTATALVCSLTACGTDSYKKADQGASSASTNATADKDKVYHIGICQLMEHEALDAATKGFQDTLTEKLGKDKVKFDVQNAQGEESSCATICNGFVSGNVDLIMANATAALQSASAATNTIPIVATSITDYATALNVEDWSGASGTNITGTSDLAPIEQQEDMILELLPDTKKVAIVYCSAEPNSIFQAQKMEKALDEDNIEYKEYTAADSNEIQSVVTNAAADCDVVYIPTDNVMAASVETVKNVLIPAGVPMIAGEEGICEAGVGTLSIDYYSLGQKTAEMAYEILVNGKNPGEMDIEYADATTKEYNKENCDKLGIKIPEDYKAIEEKDN
ncbi:MAG: ABC transporter substrate-binding protein [Lachnospiraceae bacterium]|nr:ABC transporter substrate-binding protein [Lachnospiraceae bacterium]